jgi:mono/diheme cytochrome c family protein
VANVPPCIGRIRRGFVVLGAWSTILGLQSGCGAPAAGATNAALSQGRDESDYGARLFASDCVKCHGRYGEGFADAPPVLGPRALPEFPRESAPSGTPGVYDAAEMEITAHTHRVGSELRTPFRTAADLEAYVAAHLPKKRTKDLGPGGIWALVTFVMAVQGAAIPEDGITPENAESVLIPRR